MHQADYWSLESGYIQCLLCPHACHIREQAVGRCGVRRMHQGKLVAEAFGRVSSLAMDPIEKKPLFHVKPGKDIFSLGSFGCNFRCSFCQNWNISQAHPKLFDLSPEQCVAEAVKQGACGVAYTYNEPLINIEYIQACAQLVQEQGLLNVVVTNGYINPKPLQDLLPLIDAWNIDIKSIKPEFYQRFCKAELAPVLETVKTISQHAHIEITHLIVTKGNDDLTQIRQLVDWIAALSPEIPLHFTRYYPSYQWEAPPTDPDFLYTVRKIAQQKLSWVYLGNLGEEDSSVFCPACRTCLVERRGYQTTSVHVQQGACPNCHHPVPGIF